MWKKWCALLLALILCTSVCGAVPAYAADSAGTPAYTIRGLETDGNVTVQVEVSGAVVLTGRFALNYDETVLELLQKDGKTPATAATDITRVLDSRNVRATGESDYAFSQLISLDEGYVMVPWVAQSMKLDATQPTTIAKLYFKLKPGKTAADFNADTFGIESVSGKNMGISWSTSAEIIVPDGYGIRQYKYNIPGYPALPVSLDYPGIDKPGANAREVSITVTDTQGKALSAAGVTIAGKSLMTDDAGLVKIVLSPGDYDFAAAKADYRAAADHVTVAGEPISKTVVLYSDMEVVAQAREKLTPGFQGSDTAAGVTQSLALITETDDGVAVAWSSSNGSVIVNSGSVFRPVYDTAVTLTATLTRGQASQTKTFVVTVLGKQGASTGGSNTGSGNTGDKPAENAPDAAGFTDLGGVPWAKNAIERLAAAGIIKGSSATTFSPHAAISRADYMTLLVRTLGLTGQVTENFADVAPGDYYYQTVGLAKQQGITNGVGQNRFDPRSQITRQDMMAMTYRALCAVGKVDANRAVDPEVLLPYLDAADIAGYAKDAAAFMVGMGYIKGSGQTISPLNQTTRAEAAVLIDRLNTAWQEDVR